MPQPQSLDDLIAKKALEYADQIKAAAAMADNEEEIRIESEKQLAFIQKEAGIHLEGRHEFTVASGRIDSVYSRVIIEYKNPKSPGDRIGPRADSPGSRRVIEQIKKRFYDMRHDHGQSLKSLFGVGLDGNHFIFVRFRDEKWDIQDPVEVTRHSAARFLWALFNLGQTGKPFSPEYLAGDFGSEGGNTIAVHGINALYNAIVNTDNPRALTFLNQWRILFGEVCGYDVDTSSGKIDKLADFYQVGGARARPAELLFAVHTYYALFIKLLAAEIVTFFHKLPTPLQTIMQAATSSKLKSEIEDLEAGSIFRYLNITNFLEGDLFAWYTSVWTEPIERLVRDMVTRLDDYNPGTLSEDPAGSRDLLKKLYQQLFPQTVRHDLGEYYTPDWLADHVLNELGYVGDPDKRLLDPACGSGTFLVMAINRVRKWYDENRELCRFDESELARKILSNVIGFDLNPLAVMTARTNYLIAIRDLVGHVARVEIPVYLCDSIMTPSEYGGLLAGGLGKARELKTAPATFVIPTEVATNREDVAKYAEALEFSVRNGYSSQDFIQRCIDDGLSIEEQMLHIDLYDELVRLDKANKNGVWARIIKNAFAPLFIGHVDYVAGNPPWIFWNNLPGEYRLQVRKLMGETYNLIKTKASKMARLGQTGKDISMLFVYVGLDRYLGDSGKLGFVITQTVFQSTAGDEFRRFTLPQNVPFRIVSVHDMVALRPFVSATNRTATVSILKGQATTYPVDYLVWAPAARVDVEDGTLSEVTMACTIHRRFAHPSTHSQSSPWIIGDESDTPPPKDIGRGYTPRKGLQTGAEGIYKLEIIDRTGDQAIFVRNNTLRSKRAVDVEEGVVSDDFVYPYTNGASTQRWHCTTAGYYLIPHTADTGMMPVPEPEMRRRYSSTYAFLNKFRAILEERAIHKQWGAGHAFYSVYNIGPYTFAPYKIVWKRISDSFAAAVISTARDDVLGEKLLIPNESLMLIACLDPSEAHFLCGALNSSIARDRINRSIALQAHSGVLEVALVPRFDPRDTLHRQLSHASLMCHTVAPNGQEQLQECEKATDDLAAQLWGASESDIRRAKERLGED